MVWVAAALGLASAIYGSAQQRKADNSARKANEGQISQALGFTDQASAAADQGFANASPFMQLLLSQAQQSGRDAKGAIGRSTEAQLYGLDNRNTAAAAAGNAALGRSGLYNSTLALGNQRAAAEDTTRQANEVLGQSGRDQATVALQSGAQIQSAYGGLASFEQARGQSRANFLGQKAGIVGGVQHVAQQGIAESYGSLGAAAGGLFDQWLSSRSKNKNTPSSGGSSLDLGSN